MAETKEKERFALVMLAEQGSWDRQDPEETQALLGRYFAWVDDLATRDIFKGGEGLQEAGVTLKVMDGQVVDGPFAETKELIAGYFLLEASDREEALAAARMCPALTHDRKLLLLPWVSEPGASLLQEPTRDGCFLLLCAAPDEPTSPQAQQEHMLAVLRWVESLKQRGILRYAEPFGRAGTLLLPGADESGVQQRDQPGELVAMYCIEARDTDEAKNIARECPTLLTRAGATIDLQQVWDVNAERA